MIDVNTAWHLIKYNAIKANQTNMIWQSLVQNKSYRIESIDDDAIYILRLKEQTIQELKATTIERAIQNFNALNCHVQRRHLISPTVAEETALVLFHPQLGWSDDGNFIIQVIVK